MNVGILFGGKSEEHEVSCLSAYSIYSHIDKNRFNPIMIGITKAGKFKYYDGDMDRILKGDWEHYSTDCVVDILGNDGPVAVYSEERISIDCIFPVLHGPYGEDGRVQGVLDYSAIPYVGCGVLSSAVCMDKGFTKDLLCHYGIPQTPYQIYKKGDSFLELKQKLQNFSYPLFVKPANLGSSVGISKVKEETMLEESVDEAMAFDNRVIIEQGVDCREIECAVIQTTQGIHVSTLGELLVNDDFYDYDTKYKKNTTKIQIPALLDESTTLLIQKYGKEVFEKLNCKGIARVDFFVHKTSGEVLFNEINTMPGFTDISMYPKMLNYDKMEYKDIISQLIERAMEDYA